jgi:hypothetical protein
MLIAKLDDIPLMTRGRGVILQRHRAGSPIARCSASPTACPGGKAKTAPAPRPTSPPSFESRGAPGRLVPSGFARSNRFG